MNQPNHVNQSREDALESLFAQLAWADAQLERIEVDYEVVILHIVDSRGARWRVVCGGYIGVEIAGFWDESIIDLADLLEDDPFMGRCLANLEARLGRERNESGSPARNAGRWRTLLVGLIDRMPIRIVANSFEALRA